MSNHKIQFLKNHQSKLRADLADVRNQKQQLTDEEEVIESLLSAVEKDLSQQRVSFAVTSYKLNGQLSLKGMAFREAVRTIIKNSGSGLRPKEITSKLQDSDFEYTGSVDMYLRVGNELSNLKKASKIRSRKGLYHIVQEGG